MIEFSEQQYDDLEFIICSIKRIIADSGSAHGSWDLVSNYEEVLKGGNTMFDLDGAESWINHASDELSRLRLLSDSSRRCR